MTDEDHEFQEAATAARAVAASLPKQLKQIMRDTYDAADTGADGAMAEEPRLFGAGRFASQASRSTGDATPHDVAAPAPGDASALDTQLQELMRESYTGRAEADPGAAMADEPRLFGAGRFGSPVGGGSVTTAKASPSGSNEALSTQMKQIMMDSHNVSFAAWRMQDGQPAGHAGGSLGLIFAG